MDLSADGGRHYTVRVSAGGLLFECFIASRTFSGTPEELPAFTEEHLHSSCELLICRQGSGFQFIDGRGHRYGSGTVFVFAPFVKHANIRDPGTPEIRYSIRFEFPDERQSDPPADPRLRAALARFREDGCFQFCAGAPLQYLVGVLAELLQSGAPDPGLLLGGLLSAVFSYVFSSLCESFQTQAAPGGDWTRCSDASQRKFLLDYYFDHLMYAAAGSEIRMDDICAQLHLSPSQLNRVLKETYGTSFKKKSIEVRLAYIKYYLKYSGLSVSEIAQRTNFLSDSGFSLFFKQHTGLSPTQYRRQLASGETE